MRREIYPVPLTPGAFALFGTVIEAGGPFRLINGGLCRRYHDLARPDVLDGHVGVSVFLAEPRPLPYRFDLIERHPAGSQAFLPMTQNPFLVIAAENPEAVPRAFLTDGAQGIQFHRGTWHGVLTPLSAPGLFAVVDRIGDGSNLEEHRFTDPWVVLPTA